MLVPLTLRVLAPDFFTFAASQRALLASWTARSVSSGSIMSSASSIQSKKLKLIFLIDSSPLAAARSAPMVSVLRP